MRTYADAFSDQKIYPGKGKIYVRGDSKVFRFQNGKTESLFLQRKNPRRIAWTTLYRRAHRKGITAEVAKKRTRKTVKQQRGIVGASLDVIKEKRSGRPEQRAKQAEDVEKAKAAKKERRDALMKQRKAAGTAVGAQTASKSRQAGGKSKAAPARQ